MKNLNHLHTELSLGYLEDPKFYLESKALFIDISSIASFKLFFDCLVAGILHFLDSSVASLKQSPWPKYNQLVTIFPKKKDRDSLSNFFFSSNMFVIRLFLANT